ncbi:MAG: cobalt transporter CbiM [Planctomycetota bacterium]
MHISEGVLSAPVLVGGGLVAVAGVVIGLRRLDYERIPRVAVLSSAFFVASLIRVPVGPSNVHLILNGLVGIILGWAAFPALLIGLLLQAVLFGYGGLTALGVNTAIMGLPAVGVHLVFNRWLRRARGAGAFALGFAAGSLAIVGGCVLLAASLLSTGRAFEKVAYLAVAAHVPVAVVEGLVTGAVVGFLRQVRPELLEAPMAGASDEEAAYAQ